MDIWVSNDNIHLEFLNRGVNGIFDRAILCEWDSLVHLKMFGIFGLNPLNFSSIF